MTGLDRREFLRRAGAFVATAALAPAWVAGRDAADPRLRALARDVRGPVITPADAAYEHARLLYNERFDAIRPLGIVQPISAADVQAAVRWARKNRVRIAARSGGHSYAGYSSTTGLVVDVRRLNGVAMHGNGTVTIGAGARLIDVVARLARRGRAIPTGSCPTVGISGLALGGGVGFASRAYGTTTDNIVSLGIVTADGRSLTCDAKHNSDLFWACRGGGGGNFGIVTQFVMRTHPAPPVSYFFASWPWSEATEAVGAWQQFVPQLPDGLFTVIRLSTNTPAPTVRSLGQFLGDESRLQTLVAPLGRVAGAQLSYGSSSYLDAQLRWAGCLGKPFAECHLAGDSPQGTLARASFRAKSDYLNKPLSAQGIGVAQSWIERGQPIGGGSLLLDSYGGAINRVAPGATAFVHRNALASAQYLSYSTASGAADWIRGFYAAMRPYVSGFAYQNYIDRDLTGWQHAYYGANYQRLRQVKRQVDPDWFFRFPQAIEPAAR
jgi:FAD/FMN-containing dehydrogenase